VRRKSISAVVAIALAAGSGSWAFAQDFDPHGRHHRPAGGGQHPPGNGHPPAVHPPGSGAPKTGDDPKGPTTDALIDRYTKIVLQQPGAPFPLQRLAQLYRDRDGNLTKLVAAFEARAGIADKDQYGATVTLAGLYKLDGRSDEAIKTYEKAIAIKADDATALLSLARLLQDRGDLAPARQRYEQALKLQTLQADKEQTVRTLMSLALDAKDWDAAKKWHVELVKLEPNSLFVKGELGRELFNRSEFQRAEVEFKELVTAAAGDNRALAPALKDLGSAQAKAHENTEAIATLKRALQVAGPDAAVRAEIYEIITEIYRADQRLPELVTQLEAEHPGDFARLALLGGLYEETGDTQKAIDTYKKALAVSPRQIDIRLRMIRLLQANGDLDKAIAEYEGLIKAAPNNPQFVFEECDALMQRGDRVRAMKLLEELESRATSDEEILARVADYYQRINENDKALKVLTRLAQISTSDPGHLVDLGDHYYQQGNTALAVTTWKRILVMIQPRAKALAAIGDVYLEHDMTAEALASFKEAVQLDPNNLGYKKQLASAYERAKSYADAGALYREIMEKAKANGDKNLIRECRSHVVTLWGLERVLEAQVGPLTTKFSTSPADIEAGRTLAEVYLRMRKLPETEATLRKVIELAPGDSDSYLALERVLVQQNKIADAIAVLEKLVVVDPKTARQVYERMAAYALQIYKDDDAIKYAARAVELNPQDAEGHRRLAEMYRSKQDVDHAIVEFRAAITMNDRLFVVYFELADLLLSKGQTDEADRLFRRVIRGAPDDELVARAARLSMQINLGKGTLESLEQDLLPMAIGLPQKPVYRRLLVEIYGNLTFGLVQRVHHGQGKDADDAKAELSKVGARAIKPLLDALADPDIGQQRIAIDVLGYVDNKNAALPLFSYATGPSDQQLRVRAMIACGALRDAALLPKLEGVLFPKDTSGDDAAGDSVAVAAAWGVARLGDSKAVPVLRRIAKSGSSEMRALAVLGLGLSHDKASIGDVAAVARAADSGSVARAAAAFALGELGADGEAETLLALAQGAEPLAREMSLYALARLGAGRASPPGGRASLDAMADALFAGSDVDNARARRTAEGLRDAGIAALVLLATTPPKGAPPKRSNDSLPVPDGNVDVDAMLASLVPHELAAKDRAAALVKYADVVQRAAIGALQTSSERARAVLDALGSGDGELAPFVDKGTGAEAARAKAREISKALEPSIVPLVRHPDVTMRTEAIVLLSQSSSDAALGAVVQGLDDSSEAVQRVALASLGKNASAKAVAAVGRLLASDEIWSMRVLAAEAMGRLGAAGAGAEATRALETSATKDTYALVRQAAVEAMSTYDLPAAKVLASKMATSDPEPRVREAAKGIAARS
jgi:tetratricopeptide (TPR) repeat protein/HEAT repeat protein